MNKSLLICAGFPDSLLVSSLNYFIPFSIGAGARFAQILSASFMHMLPTSVHNYGLKRTFFSFVALEFLMN